MICEIFAESIYGRSSLNSKILHVHSCYVNIFTKVHNYIIIVTFVLMTFMFEGYWQVLMIIDAIINDAMIMFVIMFVAMFVDMFVAMFFAMRMLFVIMRMNLIFMMIMSGLMMIYSLIFNIFNFVIFKY